MQYHFAMKMNIQSNFIFVDDVNSRENSNDSNVFFFFIFWHNIFTGFCTEYSFSGNMIQQNIRTRCPIFENNRCPMYYRSTDAYKCELRFVMVLFRIHKNEHKFSLNLTFPFSMIQTRHVASFWTEERIAKSWYVA